MRDRPVLPAAREAEHSARLFVSPPSKESAEAEGAAAP